ncbi:hypothetical protein IHV25_00300 [Phaeovibrio sulfidiphilus]|uniref:Glutamine amidotransferase domain-containing protein n=1 Tax=Phaeovibrio sulfidiphilus TaxID=1220600 RepID=A0A8J6YMM2_9PROT|nr:hypothetical protein [Phaeovibrio sulfidiphilus]MBE1236101.1 hypothetical protein [Phaeovibrio sulfidiphilus]
MTAAGSLVFAPLVPWPALWTLAALAAVVLVFALVRRARGALLRALAFLGLLAVLAGPRWATETQDPLSDVALLVIDESASIRLAGRAERTGQAATDLERTLKAQPNLETRIVRVSDAGAAGTVLADALDSGFADVPVERRAGVLILTDGQIHDAPEIRPPGAPVHVLLTGHEKETDRRIAVLEAPRFGMTGSKADVRIRIEDPTLKDGTPLSVTLRRDGEPDVPLSVPANRETAVPVPLTRPGPNIVELSVAERSGEIAAVNNRVAISINGVRDRLRVLLISGKPHMGERVWRNSLKADPAVDLIHFTILRSPWSRDPTSASELSLIPFPINELFEEKIGSFDLILLDRFSAADLVPEQYLENVAKAVENGAALLLSAGPEFNEPGGLGAGPLARIVPASATGRTFDDAFRPSLTAAGVRHPVTAALEPARSGSGNGSGNGTNPGSSGAPAGAGTGAAASGASAPDTPLTPDWGPWLRQVEMVAPTGTVVMGGVNDLPLLILSRVGKGRVAVLTSDTLWLWAKGWQGGGPQGELLRRLAHWTMGEPDLEEEALTLQTKHNRLVVTRRTMGQPDPVVTVTGPEGPPKTLVLSPQRPGLSMADMAVGLPGVYRAQIPGGPEALAVSGPPNPPETTHLVATARPLSDLAQATGGSVRFLGDGPVPEIRRVAPGSGASGRGWVGLRANGAHVVTGLSLDTALPVWAALLLVPGLAALAWWREGSGAQVLGRLRKIFSPDR